MRETADYADSMDRNCRASASLVPSLLERENRSPNLQYDECLQVIRVIRVTRDYGLLATTFRAGLFASSCTLTFCKPAVNDSICFCCCASRDSKF
jgi:hypothetical protein